MSHQILGQKKPRHNCKLSKPRKFDGRRLQRDAFEAALRRPGVSGNERKVAEYLAPLLERGPLAVSYRQIKAGTGVYNDGVTRGLRRAVEHGFFGRDESTRPHTFWLCDEWLIEAGEAHA